MKLFADSTQIDKIVVQIAIRELVVLTCDNLLSESTNKIGIETKGYVAYWNNRVMDRLADEVSANELNVLQR